MHQKKLILFFIICAIFNMAASFAHPVTPTLIVERNLDSSMFGVAFAAMMSMYFLFSPFWGKLCDYIPLHYVLLICCSGYAAGQVIFAMAQSEALVVGGRMFAGVFTGGAYTAMANFTAHHSEDPAQRGRNFVILSTVQSVCSAVGYFIGGMLGLISVETAFLAQIVLLAGSGVLWAIFCRTDGEYQPKANQPLRLKDVNPFAAFLSARHFVTPLMALVFAITAISAIGQNSYEQCFNYYIKDQYGMSSAYNGIFKAAIAGLTLFLNMTVSLYLQKRTDINKTFLYILMICTVLVGSILFQPSRVWFIAVYIIYSSVMVLRLPLLQTMTSNQADSSSANAAMGLYQAMISLGGIFGALFAGLIYNANPNLPFVLAFIAFLIATLIGFAYQRLYRAKA